MPLMDYLTPVFGFGGPAVGALGLWHATRTKTKSETRLAERDDDREDEERQDERWVAMLEEQRKVIDTIRSDLDHVRAEVAELRTLYDRIRSLFRTAADHIRDLRARWPGTPDTLPALPNSLRGEI